MVKTMNESSLVMTDFFLSLLTESGKNKYFVHLKGEREKKRKSLHHQSILLIGTKESFFLPHSSR